MAHNRELEQFVEDCRQLGLADIKAWEAAADRCAEFVPQEASAAGLQSSLFALLKAGAEYARFADRLTAGESND